MARLSVKKQREAWVLYALKSLKDYDRRKQAFLDGLPLNKAQIDACHAELDANVEAFRRGEVTEADMRQRDAAIVEKHWIADRLAGK